MKINNNASVIVTLHSMRENNIATVTADSLEAAIESIYLDKLDGRDDIMNEICQGRCYLELSGKQYIWLKPEAICGLHNTFGRGRITFNEFVMRCCVDSPSVLPHVLTSAHQGRVNALFVIYVGGRPVRAMRHTGIPAEMVPAVAGDIQLAAREFKRTASVTAYVYSGDMYHKAHGIIGPHIIPETYDVNPDNIFK